MNYFRNCHTLEELKAEYRKLAKTHHPDMGGDLETMQAINAQYDEAVEHIKRDPFHADHKRAQKEAPDQWRAVVEALIKIPNLIIELCGSWIWITGDTYTHREVIKSAGCIWSSNKRAWYWHAPEDISMNRKRMTLEEIRMYHGSKVLARTGSGMEALEAATA